MDPPLASAFSVGWISALPVELTAAKAVLDETYKSLGSTAQYTLGRIHHHNVVLACLPAGQIGTNAAATVAAQMKSKFPNIDIGLMVGIGAGVPSIEADIRLGDVVISQPHGTYSGVVQYDLGKTGPNGYNIRTGCLNAPPASLLTAVSQVRSTISSGESNISKDLSLLAQRDVFNPSNAGPDILYRASYNHAGNSTCDRCNANMVVSRIPRDREEVVIHYGTIASGNQVIKDGSTRDALSTKLGGVLCFEMEAAGLMNNLPSLVVRGICDYADSHKNKRWQPFAAAAAAACAKEVLSLVPSKTNEPIRARVTIVGLEDKHAAPRLHARLAMNKEEREQYLTYFKFGEVDARHAMIKAAHTNTCKWVLRSSEYEDWLSDHKISSHGGFLWIKGKPGSGKSTMMKFVYTEAKKKMHDTTVLSFFFNARGGELERTTLGMYRSLLSHLLETHTELQVVLDSLASKYTRSFVYEIETIKSLFQHAIEHFGQRSLTCFIDALDECDEDHVREMISFFEQLTSLGTHRQFLIRVCFSSRHYPHITINKGTQLILDDQEGHRQDIATYLCSELKARSNPLIEHIRAEILRRASGVFLWVVLVVKILNKAYDQGHLHKLKRRLDEIPDGLNALFEDGLTRDGENIEELIICFQWTLFAARPLSPAELYFAILAGVEPEEFDAFPREIAAEDMERYILSSSKGLVKFSKSNTPTVQFIHESVRDYLLSKDDLKWLRPDLAVNFSGLSHERLKQFCEKCIRMAISKHLFSIVYPSDKHIMVRYAVQNILYHADAAGQHGIPQNAFVEKFPWEHWKKAFFEIYHFSYDPNWREASPLLILAERDLSCLIQAELGQVLNMDIGGEFHLSPLHSAISLGNRSALRALLTPAARWSSRSDISETMRESVVRSLLKSYSPTSLVMKAANTGDITLLQVLLETGKVDANPQNRFGQSILSSAIEKRKEKVIRFLLSSDHMLAGHNDDPETNSLAEVNSKDKYGRTALSYAVITRNKVALELLLDCPIVDVEASDNGGRVALHLAVVLGYTAIVKVLLAHPRVKADFKDKMGQTPLSLAAKKGDLSMVEVLLTSPDVNVNSPDATGRTPLCLAAREGRYSIVKILLERPDIEAGIKDAFSRTPQWYSNERGHREISKLLEGHSGTTKD